MVGFLVHIGLLKNEQLVEVMFNMERLNTLPYILRLSKPNKRKIKGKRQPEQRLYIQELVKRNL